MGLFKSRIWALLILVLTQQRTAMFGAAAVAAYHAEKGVPLVDTLLCDDAAEVHWLTHAIQLCWVHDGRLYKKMKALRAGIPSLFQPTFMH